MHTATIHLTRPNKSSAQDDKIVISRIPKCPEMYRVTYITPEFASNRQFISSYSSVLQYVEDILLSLQYDTDPYDQVQTYTAIHPCVLYNVADMSDCCVRRTIVSQFRDAMRFGVTLESE